MRLPMVFLCMVATCYGQSLTTEFFPELVDLYKTAQQSSTTEKIIQLRSQEASSDNTAAASWLWPSLTAALDANETLEQRQDPSTSVYVSQDIPSLTLTYPIYHSGAYSAAARRGKEGIKQAYLQNLMDRQGQKAQIEALYFDLMLKKKRLAIAQDDYDAFERNLQATVASSTSELSLEDQRLEEAQKKLDLERMQDDIFSVEKRLKKEIGITGDLNLKFTFTGFPGSLHIPAQWGPAGLLATPLSRSYESQARAERDAAIEARAGTLPLLDFVTGYYQTQVEGVTTTQNVQQENYFIGIQMRWALFNGFRSESMAASARSRERRLQAQAQEEVINSRDALEDDLTALKNQAAAYDIALARKQIASNQYDAQVELQKQGQTSKEAYEAAKRNYATMEVGALESLTEFLKIYAKVERTLEMDKNA